MLEDRADWQVRGASSEAHKLGVRGFGFKV